MTATIETLRINAETAEREFLSTLAQHGADAEETNAAFRALTLADARHVSALRDIALARVA